jgi:transposase
MARIRRAFSPEFKREAVQLLRRPSVSVNQAAKQTEIDQSVPRRCVEQFEAGAWEMTPGKELKGARTEELEKLRRELNRVKMERDIQKKALAYFAKEPS